MASLRKRNGIYYLQYSIGANVRRVSTHTESLQLAKEKKRKLESSLLRGDHDALPTQTPIGKIIDLYVSHIRAIKTAKSAQTDIYYLREVFGPICPALESTSRRLSPELPHG